MRKITRVIAGSLIIISAIMILYHSIYWIIITLFVGLNLFQYGITDWCLMEKIFDKIGVKK